LGSCAFTSALANAVCTPQSSVLLTHQGKSTTTTSAKQSDGKSDNPLPPELEHCDKALVEKIEAEIVHSGQVVTFDEIAGLEFAKKCVNELICWLVNMTIFYTATANCSRLNGTIMDRNKESCDYRAVLSQA
jgi:hypothetical protein